MGENASNMQRSDSSISRGCAKKSAARARTSSFPQTSTTVADLVGWLKQRGPQYGEAFARPQVVRAALDKVHVKPSAALGTAREIAFFPPVTGG